MERANIIHPAVVKTVAVFPVSRLLFPIIAIPPDIFTAILGVKSFLQDVIELRFVAGCFQQWGNRFEPSQ